jgi:aminoglycoside phosphotransferase (APT) family kinase protein
VRLCFFLAILTDCCGYWRMQFGHGQSNPTYLLQVELHGAVQRYVLRKKPPGHILQSAHAVEREYQVNFLPLTVFCVHAAGDQISQCQTMSDF